MTGIFVGTVLFVNLDADEGPEGWFNPEVTLRKLDRMHPCWPRELVVRTLAAAGRDRRLGFWMRQFSISESDRLWLADRMLGGHNLRDETRRQRGLTTWRQRGFTLESNLFFTDGGPLGRANFAAPRFCPRVPMQEVKT